MKNNFDYQGAKKAGYSDEEISSHLAEYHPKFDYQGATEAGYTLEEINEHLSTYKPKKSTFEKGARVAGQYALGLAESALLPYELAVAPLASKTGKAGLDRDRMAQDIQDLMEQKQFGKLSDKEEELLNYLTEQYNNPEKTKEQIENAEVYKLGVRDIAEKISGQDLHPEGILEKAAGWAGFIKDPKKIVELAKSGIKLPQLIKAISPTGTETLRGLGAGTALELAEEGEFGPIGTMAAVIAGDLIGGGASKAIKGGIKLVTQPTKTLAEAAAKFTPKDKLEFQKEIIKDFRDSGIQADLGSITDNNLIRWTQSRLAQSGLTGKAFEDLKKELTDQIEKEYKALAEELGNSKYASTHEAGEIAKEGIKSIREADLAATRQLYKNADKALKENAFVDSKRLASSIEKLEKQLKPGQLKSGEQNIVLDTLDKIKRDLFDSEGNLLYAKVKDLMNNKIALNDIINYETQGGAKQLLKGVVSELDRTIISHGKENPTFAKNYINANKKFSEHAKTFRNKNVDQLLKTQDPSQIMNKMNNVQGIRDLDKVLSKSPQGKQIFNNLKRQKLDQIIGNNLIDSTTQQAKLGTFSKLLEKGKNREIIKEILGAQAFKKLEKLQKNAGRLANSVQKFHNTSQSMSAGGDAAIVYHGMSSIVNLLMGNPWPLVKTAGGIIGAKKFANLLADPAFIKLTEEAILASEKGGPVQLISAFEKLKPYILSVMNQENE